MAWRILRHPLLGGSAMVRLFAALVAAFLFAETAMASVKPVNSKQFVREFKREMAIEDMAEKTDRSLGAMVKLAVWKLRAEGYDDLADEIEADWQREFAGFLPRQVALKELGDHEPLSQWLAAVTALIELAIGPQAMKLLHLDDLVIFNYAIPVVFDPTNPEWDMAEYSLHFVPLAGVTGYWTSYVACVGATWGGGMFFLCTPASSAVEWILVKYVAPKMSDRVYMRANSR